MAESKEIKKAEDVSARQDKLIPYLLTESSIEAACKKAGIGAATYYRWLSDKAFVEKFRQARNLILENTVARLQSLAGEAVETLKRNLSCGNPAAENRAAIAILDQTVKGVETLDIVAKLEAVQTMLKNYEDDEKGSK
jgi:hypothetical protein